VAAIVSATAVSGAAAAKAHSAAWAKVAAAREWIRIAAPEVWEADSAVAAVVAFAVAEVLAVVADAGKRNLERLI
jgi:hypothetical protein